MFLVVDCGGCAVNLTVLEVRDVDLIAKKASCESSSLTEEVARETQPRQIRQVFKASGGQFGAVSKYIL